MTPTPLSDLVEEEKAMLLLVKMNFYPPADNESIFTDKSGCVWCAYHGLPADLDRFLIPYDCITAKDTALYCVERWAIKMLGYVIDVFSMYQHCRPSGRPSLVLALLYALAAANDEWRRAWITLVDQGASFEVKHAFMQESTSIFPALGVA